MKEERKNLIKETVRNLRRGCTKSEKLLWEAVRNRKINSKKFQRQYPIKFEIFNHKRFFIPDFYCHECKLAVELDGKIHEHQKDYDEMRTHIINNIGIKVIRFTNEDIENNLEKVLLTIKKYL